MTANLPEHFAALTMQQQPDVPGDTTEAAASLQCSNDEMLATPERMTDKCECQSSNGVKLIDTKECEASVPLDVEHEANVIAEREVVDEEPERKAPTESAVVDIGRQLQKVLHEKGPCQEGDLMGALSLSQAQLIIEEYGTLMAFIDRYPAFRVVREDLCFVYYKDQEKNEDGCHSTSLLQDGATIPSASYNDGGRQPTEGYDDGPRRARVSSSSSSTYESAVEGADGDQDGRSMKDGWSQVSSPPRCMSRALQAVPETCDAEVQTQGWDPSLFIEMKSTLQKRDAVAAELKGKLEALRESHASEEQELRVKIDELLQTPRPEKTWSAAEVKNPTGKKDKPTGTNGEEAQVSPPPLQPRPLLRESHPLPLPRPENKPRSPPVDPRPRPQPPSDKELSRYTTPPPAPDFSEHPGSTEMVAAPRSDVEPMQSSQEEVPTKSKVAQQISKIVRMVKRKEPNYTDEEVRRLFDHVRRSHGGFSRMTFNAIVTLLLDNLQALRQEQH